MVLGKLIVGTGVAVAGLLIWRKIITAKKGKAEIIEIRPGRIEFKGEGPPPPIMSYKLITTEEFPKEIIATGKHGHTIGETVEYMSYGKVIIDYVIVDKY